MQTEDKNHEPYPEDDEPTDTGALSAADRVDGRFRIIRMLAKGGMSVVYLAEQEAVGRLVALKVLKPPREAGNFDFAAKFRDEARTLASFQHPNVVVLHDFGTMGDGRVYLAMEYIDGPRLADLLRRGPLETERSLRLLLQVARALRYTHQRGVIHRDLSPSNILITSDEDGTETAKLIDFGIASETSLVPDNDETIVGSPSCMAPEQIRGAALDERVDIYAFGVVAFRTLTGRYPFRGKSVADTLRAHLTEPVPKVASLLGPNRNVPDAFAQLVERCLAKKREDRPDDMEAVLGVLQAVLDEIEPSSLVFAEVPILAIEDIPPPKRSTLWLGLGGGVLLMCLLAVAVGVWWSFGQGTSAQNPSPEPTVVEPTKAPAVAEPEPASPRAQAEPSPEPAPPSAPPAPKVHKPPVRESTPAVTPAPAAPASKPARPAPAKPVPQPEPEAPGGYKTMPDF